MTNLKPYLQKQSSEQMKSRDSENEMAHANKEVESDTAYIRRNMDAMSDSLRYYHKIHLRKYNFQLR